MQLSSQNWIITCNLIFKIELECAVDGAQSQIPMLKLLTPSTPKSTPGAWPRQQNENSIQYVFYLLLVRIHKYLWNWLCSWNLMIFDLWTSPQGHQFDPRVKILIAFCSARHSCQFDMPHDHVWKNKFLTPLGTPVPQSPTSGAWPRCLNENPIW